MISKIRSRKGFTLIELMIVVAIIAILAAIAIPNFLKFQAKSKQSEARTMLTGVYEAEMGFFSTENYFSSVATKIGFEAASKPKYYIDPSRTGWIVCRVEGPLHRHDLGQHRPGCLQGSVDRDRPGARAAELCHPGAGVAGRSYGPSATDTLTGAVPARETTSPISR